MAENTTTGRITANAVGCVLLIVVCVPLCISLAWTLAGLPPPKPSDPDGGKAEVIYLFGAIAFAVISLAAIVSLIRSMRTLKKGPMGDAASPCENPDKTR